MFVVARWSRGECVARDVFLVAGHLNGLKSKTLAQLAFCSEAHVSRTLARYERGGTAALLTRGRPGRKPTMTAARTYELSELEPPRSAGSMVTKA